MTGQRRAARISTSAIAAVALAAALAACTGGGTRSAQSVAGTSAPAPTAPTASAAAPATQPARPVSPVVAKAPASPPARVCGNQDVLTGPATAPSGAVRVPAGSNASVNFGQPGATYWFAPGVHTLGSGQYSNIRPGAGATFVGAPGAILDGQHKNNSAFDDTSAHVVIEYLTIRNFGTLGGGAQQGVVNHDSGPYWMISHSTVTGNAGAGIMLGSHDTLLWNCLQGNQQYGFSAYSNAGAVADLMIDHNEIAGNDTYDYEARQPGCGCSGGGKFWNVINATVTDNWVHDNKSTGLWADTNNAGFEFAGNYFQNAQGVALMYEISYNAVIEYNTFVHNGASGGPAEKGFPLSAIYISESGADKRVNSNYKDSPLLIAHNNFDNNWGGVILWENSNRFCASPDNSSSGYCTMVDPKATLKTCRNPSLVKAAPLLGDCRWKTQDALVEDNQFSFDPPALGQACTVAANCGFNGVFSEYGSDPSWSPYHGNTVPTNITFNQGNKFTHNTYSGPWCFIGWQLGTEVSFSQWQAAASVGQKQFGQEPGSTRTGPSRTC
jgi:Right handed beta helix region